MKLPMLLATLLALWLGLPGASADSVTLAPVQRLQTDHLKATHEARKRFTSARVELPELGALQDFRAVIHVHAEDADHTKGNRDLERHGLSPGVIRGVIDLSGVYNLDIGDAQAVVFGKDRSVRREASPLFFVKTLPTKFFVSYCEWDYPTLPSQARTFHAALHKAGVDSELFFTPRESHISEIIAMTHDDDPTGQAVVKFILGQAKDRKSE